MKKKLFSILFAMLLFVPFFVKADEKVKVYIFEAGGCPYCEAEVEYLKGLDSYNEKFTIEIKELYVDHIDWVEGKDYALGKKVAEGFLKAGFTDASYQGTPFVVISDLYAASAYSESLESVINEAYEKGDKDIVGCYADGKDDCLSHITPSDTDNKYDNKTNSNTASSDTWVNVLIGMAIIATIIIKSTIDTNKIVDAIKANKVNINQENKNKQK